MNGAHRVALDGIRLTEALHLVLCEEVRKRKRRSGRFWVLA